MRCIVVAAWALVLGGASPAAAQSAGVESKLYPPELVMRFGSEIELSEAQRERIRESIKTLQSDVIDLQWELQEQGGILERLLREPRVDADAALAQAQRVLEIEWQVKKRHLAALIEIKNSLTPEQQEKLQRMREEGAGEAR